MCWKKYQLQIIFTNRFLAAIQELECAFLLFVLWIKVRFDWCIIRFEIMCKEAYAGVYKCFHIETW